MPSHGQESQEGERYAKDAFAWHAASCRHLGSPFVARICDLFAARLEPEGGVAAKLCNWPGERSMMKAIPLRVVGALHALVLEGRSHELARVFPPHHEAIDDDTLWRAMQRALSEHANFVLARLENAPQTNEVSRAAILLPGFLTLASLTGLPLVLSELGASAGLNLFWDEFGYRLGTMKWGNPASPVQLAPHWTGTSPPSAEIRVGERAGCDVSPLDPASAADRSRLLSYIWADQAERIARMRAALDVARRARVPIAKADAVEWLSRRLAAEHTDSIHVVYHTIVWPYLSPDARQNGEAMIRAAGARATRTAPLAWLRFEADEDSLGGAGGALTMTAWPAGEERLLARADFHGRWVDWLGYRPSSAGINA